MPAELSLADLRSRLAPIETAMLTTIGDDGRLGSRPLAVQDLEGTDVAFIVNRHASWVAPGEHQAEAAFAGDEIWVSVSGTLRFVDDLVDEYWHPRMEPWFPGGRADATIAHLAATRWNYWVAPNAEHLAAEIARAQVTGTAPDLGGSGSITVS